MNEQDKRALSEINSALGNWAAKFLATNSPKKLRHTRRLSYAEALIAAQRERKRYKIFGHYGEK